MSFKINLLDFTPVSLANCRNYLQYLIVSQFYHDSSTVFVLVGDCCIKVDTIIVPVKTCRIARGKCIPKFVLLVWERERPIYPQSNAAEPIELSKKLGIHKSTVSRLLNLLADNGFLQKNSETKKYILGRAAAEIGNAVHRSLNNEIVTIAQPYLNELCEAVGESVALEIVTGTKVVLAYHSEGRRHIRFSFKLGEQVPLHVVVGAKTILAYNPSEFVNLCLQGKLNHYTKNTIVSKSRYLKLLAAVRKTGLAYDYGERYEDTRAIAAPILNHDGIAVAAVVIAGPAFRMTDQFFKQVTVSIKRTAAEISQKLFA